MAVKPDPKASPAAPSPKAAPSLPTGPSALELYGPMLVPLYALSLCLVFLGERVTSTDQSRMILSGLGVAGAVILTVLRFAWAGQVGAEAQGERRSAERTLALLHALGLVAVALYFATTDGGKQLLHISKAAPETRARIEGALLVGWVSLLTIALTPLLFGELAIAPMRRAPQPEVRRVRSAIGAAFSLAFAILYAGLFTYAAGELDAKIDFSYFRTARPSESTKKIAESTSDPITITAFFPQLNEVGAEVQSYLAELAAGAPKITVKSYDRLMVPAIAKEAKITQDGVIVLERGQSRETLVIGAEMKSAANKLKSLDGDFQKSLLKVLREARIAYLTVGHGELNEAKSGAEEGRTAKNFRRLLESQNYVVKDLGLSQGLGSEIPADATIVICLGPAQPLLPEEIGALKRYADKGGHLLLALDPDAKVDHGPLADAVGLRWSKTVLANDKVFVRHRYNNSDRTILVTNRFSSHASVSTLGRNAARAPVIFPGASELDKKDGTDLKIDFAVKAMPETFADENGNFELDGAEKRNGSNLGAAVSKTLPVPPDAKKPEAPEMRAFVVADADSLSDAAFANEPNVLFALDVVRWLGGEESFSGSITTTEDVRIEHTKQKDQIWFYATIVGAPGLLLGVGLVATRRRKDKKPTREKSA
ncbi:MAG: Gldg family protein [Byssovorax sp.]